MSNIKRVYRVKMAVKELVTLEKFNGKGNAMVTYVGRERLGLCPIDMDRLYPEPVDPIEAFEHWWDVRLTNLKYLFDKQMKLLGEQ